MLAATFRRARRRLLPTFAVGISKIFLSGVVWQIFGLLADNVLRVGGQHSTPPFQTTLAFSALVGAGDALGVVIGQFVLSLVLEPSRAFPGWRIFWQTAGALGLGSALSGAAWQGALDGCIDASLSFEASQAVVGSVCGMLFFLGVTTGRALVNLPRDTARDVTLAAACGTGAAFFVGTDLRYPDNWLQPVVGERTGVDTLDCVKAGLSVLLGFLAMQLPLILCVPNAWMWCDAADGDSAAAERHGSAPLPAPPPRPDPPLLDGYTALAP